MSVSTVILLSMMQEIQLPLHEFVCTSPLVPVPIQVILVQEPKKTASTRHLCSSALCHCVKIQVLKEKHPAQHETVKFV